MTSDELELMRAYDLQRFWKRFAIIVLVLVCAAWGYDRYADNKVRLANITVKNIQYQYNEQLKQFQQVVKQYEEKLNAKKSSK